MEWATDLQDLGIVALAGGLGAVIGLERELSDKPAGLRTHIFVSAGAALLMLLGAAIVDDFQRKEGNQIIQTDPIRVMQAIVIGISFLGAGTIIHQGRHRVEGLTTAASIFLTAGIGIAVAVGHIVLAAGTTLFAVITLVVMGWVKRSFGKDHDDRDSDVDKQNDAGGRWGIESAPKGG